MEQIRLWSDCYQQRVLSFQQVVYWSFPKVVSARVEAARMDRYKIIKEVGSGSFGSVWQAINRQSGEMVAIKKLKKQYYSWEECMNLREVKSLRKMNNHPNVVKLKDVIMENCVLYSDCNLYQLMKGGGLYFSEAEIRNWCFQVFQGLAYIHQHGYFHRDLKPENLLVSKDIVKIADFGLAREINSQPPFTEYVSTRWYRAPEVLLQSPVYGSPVDMWAMGAIMAELFTLCPLFPGLRCLACSYFIFLGCTEADEIYKICRVLGSPTKSGWAEGLELASDINYQFPNVAGVQLSSLLPGVGEDAIDLIKSLCSWDPCTRPTAAEALQHPFFQSCFYVPPSLRFKDSTTARTPPAETKVVLEQESDWRYQKRSRNPKPTNGFLSAKKQDSITAGAQWKLDISNQDVTQDYKNYYKTRVKQQPKYQPPGVNRPCDRFGRTNRESDITEKLSNITLNSVRPLARLYVPPPPPPLKAGKWRGQSQLVPGKACTRKDAG